jgi:hypothetical protein
MYGTHRTVLQVRSRRPRHSKAFYTALRRSPLDLSSPPKQLPEGLLAEATRDACDEHRAPPTALLKHVAIAWRHPQAGVSPEGRTAAWDDSENYWFLDAKVTRSASSSTGSGPVTSRCAWPSPRRRLRRHALHDICEMIGAYVDHVLDNDEDLDEVAAGVARLVRQTQGIRRSCSIGRIIRRT